MGIHRAAAQRDTNEPELITLFRSHGFLVQRHTAWDLDLACPDCHAVLSVEVKTHVARRVRTPTQTRLVDEGWPLHFVTSLDEGIALMATHRGTHRR